MMGYRFTFTCDERTGTASLTQGTPAVDAEEDAA